MFPSEEKYALSQQLCRAVQSVPVNIAEAHGRFHLQVSIRFCYIARGPLDETLNHLLRDYDLNYIPNECLEDCREIWREIYRLLSGYIEHLRRSHRGDNILKLREGEWLNGDYPPIPDPCSRFILAHIIHLAAKGHKYENSTLMAKRFRRY